MLATAQPSPLPALTVEKENSSGVGGKGELAEAVKRAAALLALSAPVLEAFFSGAEQREDGATAAAAQPAAPAVIEAPGGVPAAQGFPAAGFEALSLAGEEATLKSASQAGLEDPAGKNFAAGTAEKAAAHFSEEQRIGEPAGEAGKIFTAQDGSVFPQPQKEVRSPSKSPFQSGGQHFLPRFNEGAGGAAPLILKASPQGDGLSPEDAPLKLAQKSESGPGFPAALTSRPAAGEAQTVPDDLPAALTGQASLWEGRQPETVAVRVDLGEPGAEKFEALAASIKEIFLRHLSEGTTLLRLELNPPHLGGIILRLQYQKSKGSLAVEVHASSDFTGRLLSASAPYLQEQLAQHHLKLESFTVTVGQEGFASQPGEGDGGGTARRPSHAPPVSGSPGAGQAEPDGRGPASLLVDRLV